MSSDCKLSNVDTFSLQRSICSSMDYNGEVIIFRSVEKKYQDQIKTLQSELDKEREKYHSVAAKHKQSLDTEMEELRQEEGKLRDQLLDALKVTFFFPQNTVQKFKKLESLK